VPNRNGRVALIDKAASTSDNNEVPNSPKNKQTRYSREQKVIFALIIFFTIAAWVYIVINSSTSPMSGMSMDMTGGLNPTMDAAMADRILAAASGPSAPAFEMFVPMWVVMSIGMMLPTAIPMIMTFNTISNNRRKKGNAFTPTWIFILGYVIVWSVFGVVCWTIAYVIFALIGPWLAEWQHLLLSVGVMFLFIGIYHISPLKNACMRGCQNPMSFVAHHWRNGNGGAIYMGLLHGATCVGCCWALMVALFPLGIMNLVWMGLFTIIMFAEKNLKYGSLIGKIVGLLMIVAGGIITIISVAVLII
jgi:predicted metal-binding membrane protein